TRPYSGRRGAWGYENAPGPAVQRGNERRAPPLPAADLETVAPPKSVSPGLSAPRGRRARPGHAGDPPPHAEPHPPPRPPPPPPPPGGAPPPRGVSAPRGARPPEAQQGVGRADPRRVPRGWPAEEGLHLRERHARPDPAGVPPRHPRPP